MTLWAAVPFVEVINRVVNFEICLNDGKIKSRRDPVWTDICRIWKRPSGTYLKTPIALYFDIKQNRNNIFDRYLKEKGLNFSNTDKDKDIFHPENDKSIESVETQEKYLSFNITFTKEEWLKIKPIEKIDCSNKKYYALKKGWISIVSNLIYVAKKLPCTFKFPQQSVLYLKNENNIDKYIVKISGSCTEKLCHAAILGECIFNFDDDENVSMLIQTANTLKIPHSKKRRTTGEQRRQFAKKLELRKGEQFKRKLIETYRQYSELAAPVIPNAPVLNQICHERKKICHSIQGSLFDSLKHLKHNNLEFVDVIKQVGYDKFFIMYWTHQQIDLYNDLIELNPIVSIDATGSVVQKIPFAENSHQDPIFLYQIVTHIDHLIIPICQMLSERHDTNILTFWLYEWISSKAQIPLDVVTDMSAALQNSICLAFCNMTYKQYLSNCFQFLMKKSKTLPQLYLRIDIAHLIHSVSMYKCFLSIKLKIKDFYLRAIGLMSTLENLSDVEKMIKALLNISQNKYGCKNDIQWVLTKLETFSFDDTAIDYKKVKNSSNCDKKNLCDTHLFCHDEDLEDDNSAAVSSSVDLELSNYIDKLVEETSNNIHSNDSAKLDDINPYCLVAILEKLIKLFKQFPSWTNVMRKHYRSQNNIATSSCSENYFKYVKDNVLEDHQPTRADMFLIEHVKTILARIVEGRAAYDKQQMLKKVSHNTKKVISNSVLNYEKNSKNKNELNKTVELNITEDMFSEIFVSEVEENEVEENEVEENEVEENEVEENEIEEKLKKFRNNANETETLYKFESSTPKLFSNFSYEQNQENNYSIVIDEQPTPFKIYEIKMPLKCKNISNTDSFQPVK